MWHSVSPTLVGSFMLVGIYLVNLCVFKKCLSYGKWYEKKITVKMFLSLWDPTFQNTDNNKIEIHKLDYNILEWNDAE